MARLENAFINQQTCGFTISNPVLRCLTSFAAVACVLSFNASFANDPEGTAEKPATNRPNLKTQTQVIPHCLESLKLSSQQQEQIKDIQRSYDVTIDSVWKQFSERYMQTITMETSLLAAIEDNLTESQRDQVRDQRHKVAAHEKVVAATNEKPNQATAKPASAVEDEVAGVGIALTSEQEAAADEIQGIYRTPLRSLNRDVQGFHTRLLSLEADKLVAIEKVLSKEQLSELRANRQKAPVPPKVVSQTNDATKTK